MIINPFLTSFGLDLGMDFNQHIDFMDLIPKKRHLTLPNLPKYIQISEHTINMPRALHIFERSSNENDKVGLFIYFFFGTGWGCGGA